MSLQQDYSFLDRLLHRFAFRAGFMQETLADAEALVFRRAIAAVQITDPVFVSGLPRSGTTILLNLLVDTGRFASHTYEDMPFVLSPLFWHLFSQRFRVDDRPTERAHGDGLEISRSSPEAFEEMVWKRFWPGHYLPDRILPWRPADRDREFDAFLKTHVRKVIAVRQSGGIADLRYVSKNNLNIARLAALPTLMREGTMLVPFREPVQHAASMLVQHRRFLRLHSEDRFTQEYMEAIGHHEFGAGLRPVDFGGWYDPAADPTGLTFWLRYWVASYEFVLAHAGPSVHLLSYPALTERTGESLRQLADLIGAPELTAKAHMVRPPRHHGVSDLDRVAPSLQERAAELFNRLQARATIGPARPGQWHSADAS